MPVFKKHISRRTVLKGVGASIALPLLDAMNPASTAWAQTPAGAPPQRFAFVGFPHGAIMDKWSPAGTGANYEMSPILQPLEPFRQHMTIVSGLKMLVWRVRSARSSIMAEPRTGVARSWRIAVMKSAQTVSGIRNIPMPGARILMIVVR